MDGTFRCIGDPFENGVCELVCRVLGDMLGWEALLLALLCLVNWWPSNACGGRGRPDLFIWEPPVVDCRVMMFVGLFRRVPSSAASQLVDEIGVAVEFW